MSEPEREGDSAVREVPFDRESELGVLAAMFAGGDERVLQAADLLVPENFYSPGWGEVFRTMTDMTMGSKAVDFITLPAELKARDVYEKAGGGPFMAELAGNFAAPAHLDVYAATVLDRWKRREQIRAAHKMLKGAYDLAVPVEETMKVATDLAVSLEKSETEAVVPLRDALERCVESLEATHATRGKITGIGTGFTELDRMTGGLEAGQMWVICARPGAGKSALLMSMVEAAVFDQKRNVLLFTLEMTLTDILKRTICRRSEVDLAKLRSGFFSVGEFQGISDEVAEMASTEGGLWIDETAGISVEKMQTRARLLDMRLGGGLDMVAVDYLQKASSTSRRAQQSRQLEVAEISSGCHLIARELNVVSLVAAQVNRDATERAGGMPKLSDLRESGSIEQDAHGVIGVARPGQHFKDVEDDEGHLELLKNRSGPYCPLKPVDWIPHLALFKDRPKEKGGGGGRLYN